MVKIGVKIRSGPLCLLCFLLFSFHFPFIMCLRVILVIIIRKQWQFMIVLLWKFINLLRKPKKLLLVNGRVVGVYLMVLKRHAHGPRRLRVSHILIKPKVIFCVYRPYDTSRLRWNQWLTGQLVPAIVEELSLILLRLPFVHFLFAHLQICIIVRLHI